MAPPLNVPALSSRSLRLDCNVTHGVLYTSKITSSYKCWGNKQMLGQPQGKDAAAKAKGVMLLPAVGFDVVPGDCLGAHLKEKLPTATHLDLESFIVRNGTGVLVRLPFIRPL